MAYLANAPRRVQVEFSQDLARLLGYTPEFRYTNRHSRVSKLVPDLRGRIHSVYVYCDILEHVPVAYLANAPRRVQVEFSQDLARL